MNKIVSVKSRRFDFTIPGSLLFNVKDANSLLMNLRLIKAVFDKYSLHRKGFRLHWHIFLA